MIAEAYKAMRFAMEAHKNQKRKYTGDPYFLHLAEVAGMVATIYSNYPGIQNDHPVAVAWLHDVLEDCEVTMNDLMSHFPVPIAFGVSALSDLEEGNRETRKRLSRERLSKQPKWIQDIKVCDLISNTSSIVQRDPEFAKVYLREKELLLEVLTKADAGLIEIAKGIVGG
jgi:guanosine-3',5'-bis(diphosphate) 3'-pyrophosphohydrolase